MTREEAIQAWEQMRSEIDKENWLLVGTINPQMVDIAIEALKAQDRPIICPRCGRTFAESEGGGRGMTREEAIQHFKEQLDIFGGEHAEAIKVAIEALKQVTGKLNNSDDSLLTADSEACKEQKSKLDLISRAEAIEALGEEPPVWCYEDYEIAERDQWRADIEAIKSVPSADRPRPIDPTCAVDPESGVVPISACEPRGPKTIIYADRIYSERPKGRWHYSDGKPATIGQSFGVICDQCGAESEYCTNFCGECGADMRGEDE